jgi:hypothetical protein
VAKNPKDSKRDLQALFKAPPVQQPTAEQRRLLFYYPEAFKRHYMDVLERYRAELSERSGKPVGWQSIRDMIMETEDADELLAAQRRKVDVGTDRPRSPIITKDDFKGWYDPEKSHLPSDLKFQYIERFVRLLRINGELDAIEKALDQDQVNYIRDALFLFFRPVPYSAGANFLKGPNEERIHRQVSHTCFELKSTLLPLPAGQTGTCLLLFRDYCNHIIPVEILLVRQRDEGPPHIYVPVFSGFLLAEIVKNFADIGGDLVFMGKLVLTRSSGATACDDGVRVLSEGTTLGTMAWFKETELNLSLSGGEDQNLSEAVFGLVAGSGEEGDEAKGLIRRVDPKRYFPDGETGRFFRYRPWG